LADESNLSTESTGAAASSVPTEGGAPAKTPSASGGGASGGGSSGGGASGGGSSGGGASGGGASGGGASGGGASGGGASGGGSSGGGSSGGGSSGGGAGAGRGPGGSGGGRGYGGGGASGRFGGGRGPGGPGGRGRGPGGPGGRGPGGPGGRGPGGPGGRGPGGRGRGPGGRGRDGRGRNGDDDHRYEERVVKINRCATVVKGGRRFSFSALVVLGDREGNVGVGFGKANEVPPTVEKAMKDARKNFTKVATRGNTIPHRIVGRFRSSKVVLVPASEGTGVIAGAAVRAVVECAGIKDVLTKVHGSTNPLNVVKATMDGLKTLRTREEVSRLRGVEIPE